MASGTINGTGSNDGFLRLEMDWTATADPANNRSQLIRRLYLRLSGSGASINVAARSNTTMALDGVNTTTPAAAVSGGAARYLLATDTRYITHNADGTKKVTTAANYPIAITFNGVYYGAFTIPTTQLTFDTIEQAVVTVYDAAGAAKRSKGVWVYDTNGTPRKAKGIWVYDANGTPRKAKA